MRAIKWDIFTEGETIEVSNEKFHHLVNVLRVRENDEILLLNGKGKSGLSKVSRIEKKKIFLECIGVKEHQNKNQISLLLGTPKKDAFEDILRRATEIGVDKIYFFASEFSQSKIKNLERIEKLLEGSMEQSNNPILPELIELKNIDEIVDISKNYNQRILLSVMSTESKLSLKSSDSVLMAIGPEGGFSSSEESFFMNNGFQQLNLPTPILRAITAVPVALGYLLSIIR